jgi:excisionase family DNA binding protein
MSSKVLDLSRQTWTPPEVARRLRVNRDKVLSWIKAGELRAVNVGAKRSGRPRYRIDAADLAAFEASRAIAPDHKVSRKRRAARSDVIEYF